MKIIYKPITNLGRVKSIYTYFIRTIAYEDKNKILELLKH